MVYICDRLTVDSFSLAYFGLGHAQLVIVALRKLPVVGAKFTCSCSLNQPRRLETHNQAYTSPAGPVVGLVGEFSWVSLFLQPKVLKFGVFWECKKIDLQKLGPMSTAQATLW